MIKNEYIREPLVKFPEKCGCLEIGLWDQLSSDNSWRPRIKKLSKRILLKLLSQKNIVVVYDCLPIRGTQYLTSGFGIAKGKRPNHVRSCVGPRLRTAWRRLWSKHEMHAAELSEEVESEVETSVVGVREFRCESHRHSPGHTSLLLHRGNYELHLNW